MKRFVARRGNPRLLITDNAKTFTCKSVKSFLLRNDIDSQHILPASPWWGGFYERLIRSVKVPLRKVLGKARMTFEEMETALIEVEGILNCRPLTHIYDDDISEALTPSHLLSGRNLGTRTREIIKIKDSDPETLSKRAAHVKNTIEIYWNQFKHLYLSELREHHMYQSKRKTTEDNNLKLGDVVIIKDDKITPRNSWRTALVDSFVIGNDGKIRGAMLITISKDGRRTKMNRPIQKLIPLEVVSEQKPSHVKNIKTANQSNPINSDNPVSDMQVAKPSLRPRRIAATTGEERRRFTCME